MHAPDEAEWWAPNGALESRGGCQTLIEAPQVFVRAGVCWIRTSLRSRSSPSSLHLMKLEIIQDAISSAGSGFAVHIPQRGTRSGGPGEGRQRCHIASAVVNQSSDISRPWKCAHMAAPLVGRRRRIGSSGAGVSRSSACHQSIHSPRHRTASVAVHVPTAGGAARVSTAAAPFSDVRTAADAACAHGYSGG